MQLCRFNLNRLGLIEGHDIYDVTPALDAIPSSTWPAVLGDPLILHLAEISKRAQSLRPNAPKFKRSEVTLHSPLTTPSKVMAAPANYKLHVALDTKDPGVDHGASGAVGNGAGGCDVNGSNSCR